MPMDKSRYPVNWNEIRERILLRDKNKCVHCGAPNGAIGYRNERGEFQQMFACVEDMDRVPALTPEMKIIRIVLTVAHLGVPRSDGTPGDVRDKMDCRDVNLASLCQRCHLRYDITEHMKGAAMTRARKKREKASHFRRTSEVIVREKIKLWVRGETEFVVWFNWRGVCVEIPFPFWKVPALVSLTILFVVWWVILK